MTNKQHYNSIIRKSKSINNQLNKLRELCQKVINEIKIHADEYDYDDYQYELSNLETTLTDLQNFDLEDSIPEEHTCEY